MRGHGANVKGAGLLTGLEGVLVEAQQRDSQVVHALVAGAALRDERPRSRAAPAQASPALANCPALHTCQHERTSTAIMVTHSLLAFTITQALQSRHCLHHK